MKVAGKEVWSSEDNEKAKTMFETGVPVKEIAKAVGRTPHAIYYRNSSVWKINRGKVSPARWAPSSVRTAKRMLRQGHTYEEIAVCVPHTEVAIKLQNNTKWRLPVTRKNSVYTNDSFFDSWSPEMAYVLGFILADGNVTQDSDRVTIAQSHDYGREHLEKIQGLIGGSVYGPDRNDSYQLTCYSRPMAERLNELGITPAKSLTATLPDVSDALLPHLVRGIFDGDGCVSRCHKRGERPDLRASVASGSRNLLEDLARKVETGCGAKPSFGKWEVVWNNSKGRSVLEWLYTNATIKLERKYAVYQDLMLKREAWGDRRLTIPRRLNGTFLPKDTSNV